MSSVNKENFKILIYNYYLHYCNSFYKGSSRQTKKNLVSGFLRNFGVLVAFSFVFFNQWKSASAMERSYWETKPDVFYPIQQGEFTHTPEDELQTVNAFGEFSPEISRLNPITDSFDQLNPEFSPINPPSGRTSRLPFNWMPRRSFFSSTLFSSSGNRTPSPTYGFGISPTGSARSNLVSDALHRSMDDSRLPLRSSSFERKSHLLSLSSLTRNIAPRAQKMLRFRSPAAQFNFSGCTVEMSRLLSDINRMSPTGEILFIPTSDNRTLADFTIQALTSSNSDERELVSFVHKVHLMAVRNSKGNKNQPDGKIGVTLIQLKVGDNFLTASQYLTEFQNEGRKYDQKHFAKNAWECRDFTIERQKISVFNERQGLLTPVIFDRENRPENYQSDKRKGKISSGQMRMVEAFRDLFPPIAVRTYLNLGTPLRPDL